MVKVQLNMRVEHYLIELLDHYKTVLKASKTAIVETAIKEFCDRNKDKITSEELKVHLGYMAMETARTHTKMEMRKSLFINNAIRRLKKMLKDGVNQDNFNHLVKVWCKEAEANGVDKILFLETIEKELRKNEGSGINEV